MVCSRPSSPQEYHKRVSQYIKTPIPALKKKLEEFLGLCTYVSGQYDQDEGFEDLEKEIKKAEETYKDQDSPKNRVFYMALPPSVFTVVAANFKKHNYSEGAINRIIVEKPFGKDLESSREMQVGLKSEFKEEEVRSISPLRSSSCLVDACPCTDLPYRPLPRKGDGQEPTRPPFRQRHARRLVQQKPHLLRPDHLQGAVRN